MASQAACVTPYWLSIIRKQLEKYGVQHEEDISFDSEKPVNQPCPMLCLSGCCIPPSLPESVPGRHCLKPARPPATSASYIFFLRYIRTKDFPGLYFQGSASPARGAEEGGNCMSWSARLPLPACPSQSASRLGQGCAWCFCVWKQTLRSWESGPSAEWVSLPGQLRVMIGPL